MNIFLSNEQAKFIQEKIKTGRYSTTDQVINEALRLLEKRERHYETWLEETRQKAVYLFIFCTFVGALALAERLRRS